jgi:hypothetical protein
MSDYQTLQTQIADWANRQDWSPALVASFIAMAEQKFNAELRVDRMIETDTALVVSDCAPLPDDWLEMDMVWLANPNLPTGWQPIRYMPREEFFFRPATLSSAACYPTSGTTYGRYTIEGRQIYFGGPTDSVNGIQYQIAYYGEVPVMAIEGTSWIYTKYPTLYLHASLMHADLHAVGEEQNAANMKQLTEDTIQKLNADHLRAKASGSRLKRSRVRSFG